MKKRVLSLFMVLVLCLTLLPTAAFAEGEDVSISGGVIGGGETGGEGVGVLVPPGGSTGEGGGIYVAPGSPTEGGGGTYIPGEDTRTEIWRDTQWTTKISLAEAASQTCDPVVKSCSHGGKNGFDSSSATCPDCNAPAVAEAALNNGEGNSQQRRFANLQTAIDADRDGGAEFKLLTDVTGDYTINGTQDTALNLNGHSIKGTVTVKGIKGDYITTTLSNTENTTTASIDKVVACDGAELTGSGYPAVIGELTLAEGATWKTILNGTALGYKVLNADGTHKWYAQDDVKVSQLNNVIINRLPITSKTLYLKVDGKNLTGNSPKVERGTTVQLCASCNAKDADVSIYTREIVGNNIPTYSQKKAEYKKIGTTWYYVVDLDANTIGTYDIYFTATKDGYSVTSSHKKLTVTKPNLSNAEITFRSSNESTYEPYRSTTTAPGFTVTYNGKTLKLGVDYTASGTASSAGVSTQTLTIKAVEGSDYTGSKTAEWRIVPHKAKVEVGDVIKAYDGTTDLPDGKISLVSAAGSAGYQAGLPLPLSEGNGFELTDAKYDSANASETEKNISFTVKLTDTNYTFDDGTTQKDFTLNGAELNDKTFKIDKATIASDTQLYQTVFNDLAKTYEIDLNQVLDNILPEGGTYGDIKYGQPSVSMNPAYYNVGGANIGNGKLSLPINKAASSKQGDEIGTVAVEVETTNYQPFTLTIHVSAQDRITPTGTPTLSKNAITYGDALNTIALSGKLHDNVNNVDVDGTFEWVDGTHIPVVGNGTYAAEWIFEPTDTEKYLTVSGRSNITVEKAQQYGKVSMAGYTYGQAPSTPTLTNRTGDPNAQVTYRYSAADSGSVQTWDISNPPALNAGTYRMYASIGDTDNYYGFEAVYCEFVVAKATPTYTVPTGLTAKYGQTLADVTLPDGWSWMDSSESVGGASTAAKTFQAKFTPTDAVNYNMVENIELDVTVNKAHGGNLKTVELEQKYTDASDHTYTPDWAGLPAGQDWTFSSEASIVLPKQDFAADGNLLTYAISGGKAGDKITLILKASCDNYEDFTITLNVTLTEKDDQKPLTITGADSVVYGQTLTLTTTGGSGTGAVTYRIDTDASTGEATIDPETGVLTPVKVGSVSVVATKAGDNDYNDITSAPFVLMIKPATPTGEPNYTKITTSGKTLKDAALTTEGSTLKPNGGKLEWVDDKDNVLSGDTKVEANTTYKWRFTPDDANYTTLTGEVELYHKSSSDSSGYSYYTIKATAGAGGSISPSGSVSVREGRDQTFTITPDEGYTVSNVKIDDNSIGAVKSYTFEKVSRTHTIEVIFVKDNTPQTGVFVDVAAGSYYEDAVDWAVENGITKGTNDTHFSPDGICTRAQAVTFLWRTAGSPKPETRTMPFTDVPVGSYYYDAVLWAVENGITKGTSDTTFSPNMTCSRAQIVTFLWRSEKSPAAGTANPFADVKSTAYYADAVLWAVKENITKGTTNTTFSPDADCTRAQIVTFLWRCKK